MFAMFTMYDPHEFAEAIEVPVEEWPGRCFEIACLIVKRALVEGTPVYGHWLGPVHPDNGTFDPKRSFQRHGWVVDDDGEIIDPTRWVFENRTPYIFAGPNEDGFYDEGGNKFRDLYRRPCPSPDAHDQFPDFQVVGEARDFCIAQMGPPPWNVLQVGWLANLNPQPLGDLAPVLHQAIKDAGWSGFIPIDNRLWVERTFG